MQKISKSKVLKSAGHCAAMWSLMTGTIAMTNAAPQSGRKAQSPTPAKVLKDTDKGRAITLRKGDMLVVRLNANATTGYSWALVTSPKMPLKRVDDKYIAAPHAPGVVGSGGVHEFRFKASSFANAFNLRLRYSRPWIKDKTGATVWNAKISIVGARR